MLSPHELDSFLDGLSLEDCKDFARSEFMKRIFITEMLTASATELTGSVLKYRKMHIGSESEIHELIASKSKDSSWVRRYREFCLGAVKVIKALCTNLCENFEVTAGSDIEDASYILHQWVMLLEADRGIKRNMYTLGLELPSETAAHAKRLQESRDEKDADAAQRKADIASAGMTEVKLDKPPQTDT